MKKILVVAGSDSSGGAGLEADQKVIAVHGHYAMTATTALTAQNTQGVYGVHKTPPDFVKQQIDACITDVGVDVLKTGMLASSETVQVVANAIKTHEIAMSVVDPVMVSTSGAQLMPQNAVHVLNTELIPLATVLTPNIPEANLLLKEAGKPPVEINHLDDLKLLAKEVWQLGPKYVFLKGGHCPLTEEYTIARTREARKRITNVLFGLDVREVIELPFSNSSNLHGTGCSLASAIACNLAQGHRIHYAVIAASQYVNAGIKTSVKLGLGSGPINHFHSLQIMPFQLDGFIDYLLARPDVQPAWHDYTFHEFVERMGNGSLAPAAFRNYMIQDYLYLIQFARANALAGYKSKTLDDIASAAAIVKHIRREADLHIAECKRFGISLEMMQSAQESQACTAYTRYVLDIGQSEDWLALQISLLPCLLGYSMIAKRLHETQRTNPLAAPNRYASWISNYVAEDYNEAVAKGCALIEKHAIKQSPYRIEELVMIFIHATKMETGFWDMGLGGEGGRN